MVSTNGIPAALPEQLLKDIERTAVELARLAGAEIVSALGGLLAVRYKGNEASDEERWRDPVSEDDQSGRRHGKLHQWIPALRRVHRRASSRAADRRSAVVRHQPRLARRRLSRAPGRAAELRRSGHRAEAESRRPPPPCRRSLRRPRRQLALGCPQDRIRGHRMRLRRRRTIERGAVPSAQPLGRGWRCRPGSCRRRRGEGAEWDALGIVRKFRA